MRQFTAEEREELIRTLYAMIDWFNGPNANYYGLCQTAWECSESDYIAEYINNWTRALLETPMYNTLEGWLREKHNAPHMEYPAAELIPTRIRWCQWMIGTLMAEEA